MIVAEGGICGRPSRKHSMLQWGRNLIVAEGGTGPTWHPAGRPLLQWGRNLIVAEGRYRRTGARIGTSFNGAAT